MSWFTPRWLRAGPGIDRNAPPKQGFALLLDVIVRNWWELIQLNLLVILFSLPLVTLPAALVAAARICGLMLEDRTVYLGRDFLEAFRGRFLKATLLGVLVIAAIGTAIYATTTFLDAARETLAFALPLTISAATALFAAIAAAYAVTLLAMRDQPLAPLLKRALLGALARPLPALASLAFVALLWVLHILFYPASIFMPAVINFSFGMLAVTFGVHQAAVRLLAVDSDATAGATYAGGSAQSARNKGKEPS
jgi:uncharacterized membrane protein YesL